MDPLITAQTIFIFFACLAACAFCDKYVCPRCIRKIKNNPWIFTPPTTPENNNQPPPNSPASSDYSTESIDYSTDSRTPLPSPATMKPDYSSGEDYIDIYVEYCQNNRNIDTSPTNNSPRIPGNSEPVCI